MVVAFVVVALIPVKSWSVDDPVIWRLVPKIEVKKPVVPLTMVAKSEVEVALVVVAFMPVKFCKVDEPVARRFAVVTVPVAVRLVVVIFPATWIDEEA